MIKRLILFAVIGLFSVIGYANDATERQALARQLVNLLQYEVQYEIASKACVNQAQNFPLEKNFSGNEDVLEIIKNSPYFRKKLQKAYDAYWEQTCHVQTKEDYLNAIALAYQEKMSTDALKEAIQFYSGSTGQDVIKANHASITIMYENYAEAKVELQSEINAEFTRHVVKIMEAYNASEECN